MQRRHFIRLVGGGVVLSATAQMAACSLSSNYPAQAVEAWRGPQGELDPRRRGLAYALTAPNPHNLQPWRVDLRESGVITVLTDPKRVLPHTDPFGRQILIGHGAFIELLVMALAEQGLETDVSLWPQGEFGAELKGWDERPVARITLRPGGVKDPLFAQVLKRHTPKSDYDTSRPVSSESLKMLMASVTDARIQAGGTVSTQDLPALRDLCWQSAQVELQTPRTVMESIELTRVGPEEILKHRDGISLNGWMVRLLTAVGQFDRSAPPVPGSQAHQAMAGRFQGHSQTSMGFVWLSAKNRRADQILAGRAYVRLQLKATELGLGVHPMSQALQEFPEMAPHYARAHQLMLQRPAPTAPDDETVQMFCRLGYTNKPPLATPRRPIASFVQT
jgi:hypothetical protein